MTVKTTSLTAAAVTACILSAGVLVTLAGAAPAPEPTGFKAEKCFGIAKAGHNDCGSTGNNSCAATSKRDSDRGAWLYMPAGTCNKIVGASLMAK